MNLSSLLSVKSEFREGGWGKATAEYPTGGSPAGEKFESASSGLDRPVVAAAAGFRLGGRTTAWEQTGTGGRRLLLPGQVRWRTAASLWLGMQANHAHQEDAVPRVPV